LSFSIEVKNELCRSLNEENCCNTTELMAAILISGEVSVQGIKISGLRLVTENAAFARRLYSLTKMSIDAVPEIVIRKNNKLKKHATYIITLTSSANIASLLKKTGISVEKNDETGKYQLMPTNCDIKNPCCKKIFLRGAFLAGGALSDPEKTYHLEITSKNSSTAKFIKIMMREFGLKAKVIKRKASLVTYLKEGENIADFLNITGAHKALMKFENIRILKDMRNNVNRMVNCDTANLEKTVNASVRQIENIKYIEKNFGLKNLSKNLREIAEIRVQHPDASLAELGQLLNPPLGKSGVNHRLRKLEQIAENCRNNPGNMWNKK
jgi:DNA-binding protein WhiA